MQLNKFDYKFLLPKYWLLWLAFGLAWLIVKLPYPILMRLGAGIGRFMYYFAFKRRHVVTTNLALCFPQLNQQQRTKLIKSNFASMGMAIFEMLISWWWPAKKFKRLAHVSGLEHLIHAKNQNQGVILLSFHFTTLEIGAALLGQFISIDGMYRRHNNAVFDYVQRKGRERHNLDSIAIERDNIKSMLNCLRQGRATWYAPDQDYGRERSVFVPFFNVPAATITATSKFARLGKAIVVPFSQVRLPNAKGYQLTIHPALTDFPSKDESADCARINQLVEQNIQLCPEQYLWAHRRFKTRPAQQPDLYSKS